MHFYRNKVPVLVLSTSVFHFSSCFLSVGLWGRGLRTDRVSIVLSRPYIADLS